MPVSLTRDLDRLSRDHFDLLVVGGGIYGLTIAADAAQRGLGVALIEQGDFGGGTSFQHLRTVHGGLRYLQSLDIVRARQSIRERRTLARIAPWALEPLPFVLPLHGGLTRGPWAMRAAFLLDRILSADRNRAVPASHHLPAGRVRSTADAASAYPPLCDAHVRGAAVWHDYLMQEADRLTLAWALAAAAEGAVLANYVSATRLCVAPAPAPRAVTGVEAVDLETGRTFTLRASAVVNATGAHAGRLLAPLGLDPRLPLMQAVNLVTRRPAPAAAVGGRTASGQHLFIVPWQGRAIVGTFESATCVPPGETLVAHADVERFLAAVQTAFPAWALTSDDITRVQCGVVPAVLDRRGRPSLDGRDLLFDHGREVAGLHTVVGTKYTTARALAERVVDRVVRARHGEARPCRTADTPLPHVGLTGAALLRHAAAHEMVRRLPDLVLRRTTIGTAGDPGDAALQEVAAALADGGWDAARVDAGIAECRAWFARYGRGDA